MKVKNSQPDPRHFPHACAAPLTFKLAHADLTVAVKVN